MSTTYFRSVSTADMPDLASALDDLQILADDESGPMIAIAREPDTGIPVVLLVPDSPVLLLMPGAGGFNFADDGPFPEPYRPLRVRKPDPTGRGSLS